MSSPIRIVVQVVVVLLVIGAGILAARAVFSLSPSVERSETEQAAPAVETLTVRATVAAARIETTGTVVPARKLTVTPEISGRLTYRNEALAPGGRLEKGALIARIDGRDYRSAISMEEARVQSAEVEVLTEQGRGSVAEREWELLGDGRAPETAPLALRGPQLRASKAGLASARASLERARLNLSRTSIRAPWNAVVIEAWAELGQVASPGTKLATLVGTDELWVRVTVPLDRLSELDIPGVSGAEAGSKAKVAQSVGAGQSVERDGEIVPR